MSVINVTSKNFKEEVLESKKTVLVDFNADWCGPCKMLKPTIEKMAEEDDTVKYVSINIDDEPKLAEEYNVFTIPCLVVIKDGKETNRSVGLQPKDAIQELIGE